MFPSCLLLGTILLSLCQAKEFYVAPTIPVAPESCLSPCYTLDQYAKNTSLFTGHANISLIFLEGVHYLNYFLIISGHNLNSNISILAFQGQGVLPSDTIIKLRIPSLIHLNHVANLRLLNVRFEGYIAEIPSVDLYSDYFNQFNYSDYSYESYMNMAPSDFVPNLLLESIFRIESYQVEAEEIVLKFALIQQITLMNSNFTKRTLLNAFEIPANQYQGLPTLDIDIQNSLVTTLTINCKFCNVTINRTNAQEINIHMGNDVVIQNCIFLSGQYGVRVNFSFTLTILNSTFFKGEYGILTENLLSLSVISCEFKDVTEEAITIAGSYESAQIQESTIIGGKCGIVCRLHELKVLILNCQFRDVTRGVYSTAKDMLIQNTSIVGGEYGVVILEASKAVLQENAVSDTSRLGILFVSVGNASIIKSTINSNVVGAIGISSYLNINNTVFTRNSFGLILPPALSTNQSNIIDIAAEIFPGSHSPGPVCPDWQIINQVCQAGQVENPILAIITNCTFSLNSLAGIAVINSLQYSVKVTTSSFYKNQGTPVFMYQGTVEFDGETFFRENTAERGGGLALIRSMVKFKAGSNTKFINNTAAEFGGAIFIGSEPNLLHSIQVTADNINILTGTSLYKPRCFFVTDHEYGDINVFFAGNNAGLGGLDIYGATAYTEDCHLFENPIFTLDDRISRTLQVSSDPTRVCFCTDNITQCENRNYLILNETRYPGETFTISTVLAGYHFGRVAGSVYTNVLGYTYRGIIRKEQHLQKVNLTECSKLTYTVSYNQTIMDSVILVLTAQEQFTQEQGPTFLERRVKDTYSEICLMEGNPCAALLTTPVFINITMEACPLGFKLDKKDGICTCDDFLTNDLVSTNLTCEIRNQIGYITRQGAVWVGVDINENNTDIYYWHRYCSQDYCTHSQTSIDLQSPDEQCRSNHSGVLCGRCRAGYSLEIGGNKCIQCNNIYLVMLLLITFAVFGILLVALIKLLNLTVSSGTINGLIFYANVVWRNIAILFPLQEKQSIAYYIITVPIAWINLDFGLETCFSGNLNQLGKTGLQFVFPLYIWCIASFIIVLSHYSTKATKFFGNNSVAVLATLFLLSYGKLFRNITDVFTFADVPSSNGTTLKVWSLDGNVRYGKTPGHIGLMIVALFFLILFILPFTLMLLLVPFLRAKSHLRPLRWINTLKPFFDTYYGPFKDKKQYQVWTGILLISRVVILIVYASTSTYSPNANILLMTLLSLFLIIYGSMVSLVYKNWSVSMLESLHLLNIVALGSAFLYYQTLPQVQFSLNPVAATSVCIALVLFLGTLIFHIAKRVLSTKIMRNRKELGREEPEVEAEPEAANRNAVCGAELEGNKSPTAHVIELQNYDPTRFRESLLDT